MLNAQEEKGEEEPLSPAVSDVQRAAMSMSAINTYRQQNRLRLIDIFTRADKDKNWQISPEELRKLVSAYNLPLSDELLTELLMDIDTDKSGTIDYREFVRGYENAMRQQHGLPEKSGRDKLAKLVTFSRRTSLPVPAPTQSARTQQYKRFSLPSSRLTRESNRAKAPVVRDEAYHLAAHLAPSTLSEPVKSHLAAYRQQTADEYSHVVDVCERNAIPLSRELLRLGKKRKRMRRIAGE